MITVYTKSNCMPCRLTKRKLDDLGVEYQEVNLEDNPTALQELQALGVSAAPAVEVDGAIVATGFQPGVLKGLAAEQAA